MLTGGKPTQRWGRKRFLDSQLRTVRLDSEVRERCSGAGLRWRCGETKHEVTVNLYSPRDLGSNNSLPVDPQHMVQYFIEQDQGHIKFFFIEDLQPSLDIVP